MKRGTDYIGVGVGAMIFDDQGRLLMTKRGQGAKNERGRWEIPGGSVELNEMRADAIVREVKEELGVDIEVLDELISFEHMIPDEGQHWIATTFVAKIKDGQTPKIMEPEKCDAIEWFTLDRLPTPLALTTEPSLKLYRRKNHA
jgi:8-oxo-dGTP diphosphatase